MKQWITAKLESSSRYLVRCGGLLSASSSMSRWLGTYPRSEPCTVPMTQMRLYSEVWTSPLAIPNVVPCEPGQAFLAPQALYMLQCIVKTGFYACTIQHKKLLKSNPR